MDALPSAGNKRKVRDEDPSGASGSVSEDEIATSDSGDSCDSGGSGSAGPPSILRRSRSRRAAKRVRFAQVTVYYFARRQGFTCVPSAGGSSLGMAPRHHRARRYSLSQFAHLRQVSHRQHLRQHLRREKLRARKRELTQRGAVPEAAGLTLADVSEDELDVGQLQVGDCFYLQPLPTKRRRALLRAAGVRRIDAEERQELRALRLSREQCGCLCQLTCEPRTCACSQAGIQCQVDRSSFPCGCSREGCANAAGRVEFNALRVRTHLLHTLLRVQRQGRQRQDEEEEEGGEEGAGAAPVPPWASPVPPETQDFQEYLAENERAVLHLHRAQELERLQAEGGEGGGHGGGHCVLGEHLDGTTWQVRALPCPGYGHCPPGSPLLGLPPEPAQGGTEVGTLGGAEVGSQVGTQGGSQESSQVGSQLGTEVGSQVGTQESFQVGSQVSSQVDSQVSFQVGSQVGSQPYLAEAPKLYNPDEKGGNGHGEPLAHLGVLPVPVAVSEEGAPPPTHLEHLGQPHLEQPHLGQPHLGQPHLGQPHLGQPHLEQPHLEHLEQPHLEHLEQPHLEQPHLPI